MYVLNSLKNAVIPTPAVLRKALKDADEDDITKRDVRPLMSILMRLRSVDPRLRGHILTRQTAVSSFSWKLTPTEESDRERADLAAKRLTRVINEIVQHQVQAVLYDVFCLELAWDLVDSEWMPRAVKRYKPVELEKVDDYHVNIIGPEDKLTRIATIDLSVDDQTRIVDVSEDDERGGLMRSIVHHGCLQHEMLKEWGNYNLKLKGILQALYEDGAPDEEIAAAKEAMQSAVQNNFLVTSRAIEFRVNEIVKGSSQSFRDMIDQIQRDICIAILGQANTAEVARGSGSRAALEVLNLIRADIHYNDMIRTERIINEQLLKYDFRLNYEAAATAAPWTFAFQIPEASDFETRVASVTQAYDGGIPMRADEVYSLLGLTRPEGVPDTMIKEAQAI